VNKSWKQRVFVMDNGSRCVFYFKDRKPQQMSLGFIPLWDAKMEIEPSASPRLGGRGVRSQLKISAPFRRTFYLGFEDDNARDIFKVCFLGVFFFFFLQTCLG
jgi:hypothetical protein